MQRAYFKLLSGSVSDGGIWYRKLGDTTYHIMELDVDLLSPFPYHVTLSELDTSTISEEEKNRAIEASGLGQTNYNNPLAILYVCCQIHDKSVPQWDKRGVNCKLLMRECRGKSLREDGPSAISAKPQAHLLES